MSHFCFVLSCKSRCHNILALWVNSEVRLSSAGWVMTARAALKQSQYSSRLYAGWQSYTNRGREEERGETECSRVNTRSPQKARAVAGANNPAVGRGWLTAGSKCVWCSGDDDDGDEEEEEEEGFWSEIRVRSWRVTQPSQPLPLASLWMDRWKAERGRLIVRSADSPGKSGNWGREARAARWELDVWMCRAFALWQKHNYSISRHTAGIRGEDSCCVSRALSPAITVADTVSSFPPQPGIPQFVWFHSWRKLVCISCVGLVMIWYFKLRLV